MNCDATPRARAFTPIFIALISASMPPIKSMINEITRSRSYSSSVENVTRKLMSYPYISSKTNVLTSTGFLRRIAKFSARCIRNRVKFLHNTFSISSDCLILILTRTELIDGSMKHLSLSVRQIKIGFITDILDDLDERREKRLTEFQPPACCDARPTPTESSAKRESHEVLFECSPNMVSTYSPWNHIPSLSPSYHSSFRSGR